MRRRVSIFDRVLKRDVRRDYMTMLRNSINSTNPCLLLKFFTTYCLPSVSMSSRMRSSSEVYKQLSGAQHIAYTIAQAVGELPDFIMVVQGVQIKQHVCYRGSQIVAQTVFKGMKIAEDMSDSREKLQLQHAGKIQLGSSTATMSSVLVDVHMVSVMTLSLDELHRIVCFEMVEDIVDLDMYGNTCLKNTCV